MKRLTNLLVDRLVRSLPRETLVKNLTSCDHSILEISQEELLDWAKQYYPNHVQEFRDPRHKKLVEFYTTFKLLRPRENHTLMDAAGGANGYLRRLPCRKRLLQDVKIDSTTRTSLGPDVDFIECDGSSFPLPNQSVDSISCHHSFEHFQRDSDIGFIKEIQRCLGSRFLISRLRSIET